MWNIGGCDGFIFSPSLFSHVSFGFGAAPSTISVTNSCHCFFPKVFCKYRHNPLGSFFVNDASSGGSKSCCGPGDVHFFSGKNSENMAKIVSFV